MNYNNTFTGWIDTDLSERGIKEIEHAASLLLEKGYNIDVTYTSRLKRAVWFIANSLEILWFIPTRVDSLSMDNEYGLESTV